MIDKRALQCIADRGEPTGGGEIRLAWPNVPAGVIMCKQDVGAVEFNGIANDRFQWEWHTRFGPAVRREMDAVEHLIQMRDPKRLNRRISVRSAISEEVRSSIY